jgi:hypothetical protein
MSWGLYAIIISHDHARPRQCERFEVGEEKSDSRSKRRLFFLGVRNREPHTFSIYSDTEATGTHINEHESWPLT